MPGVVQIPVAMQQASLLYHTLIQGSCGVRSENVKRSSLDSLIDRPFDCTIKNRFVIIIHAKNEASVYHDPKIVKTPDGGAVVSIEILILVLLLQIRRAQSFEPD